MRVVLFTFTLTILFFTLLSRGQGLAMLMFFSNHKKHTPKTPLSLYSLIMGLFQHPVVSLGEVDTALASSWYTV